MHASFYIEVFRTQRWYTIEHTVNELQYFVNIILAIYGIVFMISVYILCENEIIYNYVEYLMSKQYNQAFFLLESCMNAEHDLLRSGPLHILSQIILLVYICFHVWCSK